MVYLEAVFKMSIGTIIDGAKYHVIRITISCKKNNIFIFIDNGLKSKLNYFTFWIIIN